MDIKDLKKSLVQLEKEREAFVQSTQLNKASLDKRIEQLQRKISLIEQPIKVSDHAVLRYLERVLGLNLDDVRAEILSSGVEAQIRQLGSGKYPLKGGGKAVVNGNVIVTVID